MSTHQAGPRASKLILSLFAFCDGTRRLIVNDTIEVMIMRMRMVKIHTRSCAYVPAMTASAINEISAHGDA